MGLTIPTDHGRSLARVDRKVRLLALRALLTRPVEGPLSTPLRQLAGILPEALKRSPDAVLAAIGHPDVLGPLLVGVSDLRPWEAMVEQAVPPFLAQIGSLPEAVIWDRPSDALVTGDTVLGTPVEGLLVDPSGVSARLDGTFVPLAELPATPTSLPLAAGPHLALRDGFPLAMDEAHPDKDGNALDLGGHSPEAWVTALDQALALVKEALPEWHADLPLSVARILPVGYGAERHLSASYREAPSQVYMTLHPDPLTMAEAIVHEGQHGKLNRLLWLDPILENGLSDWAPSPVRPDLRPLLGILLAVHAFVPVALLHERLADHPWPDPHRFRQRRAEVLAGNRNGLKVLAERARPTSAGRRLLREIQALQARLEAAGAELPAARPDALPPG